MVIVYTGALGQDAIVAYLWPVHAIILFTVGSVVYTVKYCVFHMQAVGEPPLFLAASVFFAIKDAISSARKDRGVTEYFRLDTPATCERIRMACVDQFTEQVHV